RSVAKFPLCPSPPRSADANANDRIHVSPSSVAQPFLSPYAYFLARNGNAASVHIRLERSERSCFRGVIRKDFSPRLEMTIGTAPLSRRFSSERGGLSSVIPACFSGNP